MSRLFYDNKEWSLNERVAKSLFDQFGKPEVDLFASPLNSKCSKYASYKPDPDAYHVNVFSLCCLNLNAYIFPPFSIVGRVRAKLAQDRVTALVIVPCWQTQSWFPQFVRLVKPGTTPLLIPAHQHLLQLPGTNYQHPIWDRLSLVRHLPTAGLSLDVAQIIRSIMEGQHAVSIQHTSATMVALLQQTAA